MVLKDLGFIDFEEPFRKFRAHGTIVRDGAKMSKSRGNVVNPDEYITKWGADTFRMYLMFLGPYQEGGDFRDQGIAGIRRFLDRVWGMAGAVDLTGRPAASAAVLRKRHQTVKKVTEDVEELRYNTSISALMEYSNTIRAEGGEGALERETVESLVIMLAPFAPHLAEECWERLGHDTSVFSASWPTYQDELTREEELELVVQINGKVRQRIPVASGLSENAARDRVLVDETVQRFVDGKEIRKIIYVPDRLINLVVS
jgi:leucyl-tRNA synthetase